MQYAAEPSPFDGLLDGQLGFGGLDTDPSDIVKMLEEENRCGARHLPTSNQGPSTLNTKPTTLHLFIFWVSGLGSRVKGFGLPRPTTLHLFVFRIEG